MYGLLIALGILLSTLLAENLVKKDNESIETFWKLVLLAIVSGVIGARIYHVIDFWQFYTQEPIVMFNLTSGGYGILGALIAGLSTIYIASKRLKLSIHYWLNLGATVVPLGQSVGRWGNFFNNELFGQNGQPIFLYESVLNLILFVILYKKYGEHKNLWYYMLGYGLIRFFLEFFRVNPWTIPYINLPTAQIISILFIITAYANLYRLRPRRI